VCTLTLLQTDTGYVVTMNRDEHRDRFEGGMTLKHGEQGSYCYPLDPEGGGTWIAMNAYGVTVALLNRYLTPTIDKAISRGKLVSGAISLGSYKNVCDHIAALDWNNYNPFDCVVIDQSGQSTLFSWDRGQASMENPSTSEPFLLTSSAFRFDEVQDYRRSQFKTWWERYGTATDIDAFHLEQSELLENSAVLMSREDTHTKSIVQISADSEEMGLRYFDEQTIAPNLRLSQLKPSAEVFYHLLKENNALELDVPFGALSV